ncbi:MAG: class I SAM-dependent RNA methyltransferase [Candidatus Diapherotrites archaeon]|nr:class I SAM-dependent RNA methyltransferase [Candidatus Diapherotrites archaeon]
MAQAIPVKLLLTSLVGLENYVLEELRGFGLRGKVLRKGRILVKSKKTPLLNYASRTVERVIELIAVEEVHSLREIVQVVQSIDWDQYIPLDHSFAVRTERIGKHDFRSIDVEREAGGAIVDWFLERYGRRPPVNLENPWVVVRVDVDGDTLFVGLDSTGERALHRRGWRVYHHPAALNATLASAMLMESRWEGVLLDPMAGGGTIPIEAELGRRHVPHFFFRDFAFERWGKYNVWRWRLRLRKKIRWIADDIYGADLFWKHVRGCGENVRSAGARRVSCLRWDATRLEELPFTPKYVVTNPPYGLRIARPEVVYELYREFARSAKAAGVERIVLITTKWKKMLESLEGAGFSAEVKGEILYGKLPVKLIVAEV